MTFPESHEKAKLLRKVSYQIMEVRSYSTWNAQNTEYSEFEGTSKDHGAQLLSEWLIQGSNPHPWQ